MLPREIFEHVCSLRTIGDDFGYGDTPYPELSYPAFHLYLSLIKEAFFENGQGIFSFEVCLKDPVWFNCLGYDNSQIDEFIEELRKAKLIRYVLPKKKQIFEICVVKTFAETLKFYEEQRKNLAEGSEPGLEQSLN